MTRLRGIVLVQPRPDLEDSVRDLVAAAGVPVSCVARAASLEESGDAPELVLADLPADLAAAAQVLRELRAASAREESLIVAIVPAGADDARDLALGAGLDDVLERPLDRPLLAARWRRATRWAERREAHDALRLEQAELAARLAEASAELERRREETLAALLGVVDLALPGATDRGLRAAALAGRLADRFGVPEPLRRELDLAARIHELGRVAGEAGPIATGDGGDDRAWRYTHATVAVLERIGAFEGAAEVIASVFENWDGTGHPEHVRAGQIPLRSRILRVVIEFAAALERGLAAPEALAELHEHAGTNFDPMVVVHLRGLLQSENAAGVLGTSVLVPIPELREGMELAADLYTDSGIKLLSRGATITGPSLEVIRRRHRAEPILQGAAVKRAQG